MSSTHDERAARRSFLRLAGSVLASGLGVLALGNSASASPRPNGGSVSGGGSDGGVTPQCTDFCYVQACDGCLNGRHRYRCYTPEGRWYGLCLANDCGDFCV
jgi:hypothetical protein